LIYLIPSIIVVINAGSTIALYYPISGVGVRGWAFVIGGLTAASVGALIFK